VEEQNASDEPSKPLGGVTWASSGNLFSSHTHRAVPLFALDIESAVRRQNARMEI
jgi:hypothetical protein